jgi:hypothetical protein
LWSCGENQNIPNPTPTTRFSCGLVVNFINKIIQNSHFPIAFENLVVKMKIFQTPPPPQDFLVVLW